MVELNEVEKKIMLILNAHALPSTVKFENGKIKTISDGFIRDTDCKFRIIAKEIANEIINEKRK